MIDFKVFSTIAAAIFLEAMPFLTIGAMLSAMIEVYVSSDRLVRISPKTRAGGIAAGVAAGLVLPTCECGVVPVAVRLIRKGVPPYVAVSYMLAAPIVNPIVLVSTFVAFRSSFPMVAGRIAIAVVVATVVGLYASRLPNVMRNQNTTAMPDDHAHSHDHSSSSNLGKINSVLIHAGRDFIDMGKFLILGAIVAALFKTTIPFEVMKFFSGNLVLSIVGMMVLAVLLSVCSEADSFVAASFLIFPAASHLAFIGIGPMVDLKLIGMYGVTFSRRMFLALLVLPSILVFILTWFAGVMNLI
jgi:uncharacterized membrane protein YraQ (UPF0718 family)